MACGAIPDLRLAQRPPQAADFATLRLSGEKAGKTAKGAGIFRQTKMSGFATLVVSP
jgi:hypothetical protein